MAHCGIDGGEADVPLMTDQLAERGLEEHPVHATERAVVVFAERVHATPIDERCKRRVLVQPPVE